MGDRLEFFKGLSFLSILLFEKKVFLMERRGVLL